mgnify:CR=1 FL=1|jgi:hypothetical protein
MRLISHRGNLNGTSSYENHPEHIHKALLKGFDVEIDVWCFGDGGYWLGHDKPQYHVEEDYLENPKFWCHAKNIESLYQMIQNKKIHCFFHQEDDVTLTSEGYMWTYTGKDLTKNSIAVLPSKKPKVKVAGICSDYIERYK